MNAEMAAIGKALRRLGYKLDEEVCGRNDCAQIWLKEASQTQVVVGWSRSSGEKDRE